MENNDIKAAYAITKSYKKAKIEAYLAAVEEHAAVLRDLVADLPEEAAGETFVQAIKSALISTTDNWQIQNLRSELMLDATPTEAPAPIPPVSPEG